MADFDLIARDIAEAQKRVLNGMTDVEDVERDANGWNSAGLEVDGVESAAQEAVSALGELSDALDRAFDLASRHGNSGAPEEQQ